MNSINSIGLAIGYVFGHIFIWIGYFFKRGVFTFIPVIYIIFYIYYKEHFILRLGTKEVLKRYRNIPVLIIMGTLVFIVLFYIDSKNIISNLFIYCYMLLITVYIFKYLKDLYMQNLLKPYNATIYIYAYLYIMILSLLTLDLTAIKDKEAFGLTIFIWSAIIMGIIFTQFLIELAILVYQQIIKKLLLNDER